MLARVKKYKVSDSKVLLLLRLQSNTRWLYYVECHNTVLGEEALLIYIVPVGYAT